MAEEKNIPGVATEKESDEVLEEIRTQTKDCLLYTSDAADD